MQSLTIDAVWNKELILPEDLLNSLKNKKIALFASVQFLKLETITAQLKDANCEILTTKAKRTSVPVQILGCDCYTDAFTKDIISEADIILYIGDGLFHPKALLISQIYSNQIKDVIIWDPVSEKSRAIGEADIIKQKKRMKTNLIKYLSSDTIGILVTVKPGQQYLTLAQSLKNKLEEKGKKAYLFLDNTFSLDLLENYPFIDTWVNTACPRIGTDDITTIEKSLINIKEAFHPEEWLQKL